MVFLLALVYSVGLLAAPGDIIFEEQFSDNGDYNADWDDSGGDADINNDTFNSSPNSLSLSDGGLTVTSKNNRIDAAVPGAVMTVWIRRGSDSFSEDPDDDEDLVFEYLNSGGTWVQLATYVGNGTPGEIFTPTFTLPSDALYSGLRLRFRLLSGSDNADYWHIDDIVITETSGTACDTYLDQFSSVSYSNSNGTLDWSGNAWSEQDSGGGGASGGLAFIGGGELKLRGNNTTNNTHITRQADTASSTQVTLSFDFSTQGNIESDDAALIQVSNDGGTSFTTLETITGLSGSPSGSRSYDITAYAAANMQVRIAIAPDNNANSCCYGDGETFEVDNLQIEACQPPTLVGVWNLEVNAWSGSGNEVQDTSGNNLHGEAVAINGQYPGSSGATPVISGNPGTCRYGVFDGSNSGYLSIDDNPLLDIADELTVTAWIYPTGLPPAGSGNNNLRTIVSKDENWEFHINGNHQIYWWWGGGSNTTSGAALTTGNWYHIAITYTSGQQKIYINGAERASGSDTGSLSLNNDPLLIGTDLNFTSRNFEGFIDEVRIYDGALSQSEVQSIMTETHPCTVQTLDHFVIDVGSGSASTCTPFAITITAEDSSNIKLTDYSGNVALTTSTSHGRWQKTTTPADAEGTLTPSNSDNGVAGYQFLASDSGDIVLELNNSHAESLIVTVTDGAAGVSSTSLPIAFSENAFVVTVTDSLSNDIVAGRDHDFHIAMVRRDSVTGVCGPANDYEEQNIKAWLTRDGADPNGILPALQSQSIPDTEPGAANLNLPFVEGEADFTLNTTDVGKYVLNFKDDASGFSDQDITGGSSTLVVRPFGFELQVPGNPAAADDSGGVFAVAGSNFSVTARAVAWSSSDDSNDNGIPDGHDDTDPTGTANLGDNATVPGFGQENPAESLRLSAYLLQPSSGADPGLGDGDASAADGRLLDSFVGGSDSTAQVFFDEVGIIELQALVGDSDYLGAGATRTGRMRSVSGYVGRFKPNKFVLLENDLVGATTIQSRINESCGSFSYMDESFGMATPFSATYYLAAVNANGNVTTNYRDAFAKLTNADTYDYGALDQATGTNLSPRISYANTTTNWAADIDNDSITDYGYGRLDVQLKLARAASPDGPYDAVSIGVVPLETEDNVTIPSGDFDLDVTGDNVNDYMLIDETDTALRFGRLRLANAFGPESADLPVTFVTEFWNGTLFTLNTADSCTAIATTAVTYPKGTIDIPGNLSVDVGGGSTTGAYNNISGGAISFTNGDAGHYFSAPGVGNTGSFNVDVSLSSYPWLQHDWNDNGDYSDAALPTATYTFGSYRGHDRVIYWREEFE